MNVGVNDGSTALSKEQIENIAKTLEENNPLQSINEHNVEELVLFKQLMSEIKQQSADADKKHKQTMCWTRWTWIIALLTLIVSICSLYLMYKG